MKRKNIKDKKPTFSYITPSDDINDCPNLNEGCEDKDTRKRPRSRTKRNFFAPAHFPSLPPNGFKRSTKRPLRSKYISVQRKRFKEDYSSGECSDYDADVSDSPPDCRRKTAETSCSLIETASQCELVQVALRENVPKAAENIRSLWGNLAGEDRGRSEKRFLTESYVRYISEKLNMFFCKYAVSPLCNSNRIPHKEENELPDLTSFEMQEIFNSKKMCDLIEDYYWILNGFQTPRLRFERSLHQLFALLEEDYKKLHKLEPHYVAPI
eukprot:TRINITY_DN11132_c0_g3_i1.p1 TRINITY_DN11132_c0_g3~~TRINITY_DN11132_c0_g3_i1.p1  ORF type:complete len:268 (-),score=38.89 TRINITY_DN11132_c0_g3_i1:118-921(-)